MPAVGAYTPTTVEWGITNTQLSLGVQGMFAFDEWGINVPNVPPPYNTDAGQWTESQHGTVTTHLPTEALPRHLNDDGAVIRAISFFDDFYNRVHIRPVEIDLGVVDSTTTFDVDVWNAYVAMSVTLNGLNDVPDGMTLTAPGAYPFVFAPLQMSTWLAAVTSEGETIIEGEVIWDFEDPVDDFGQVVGGERAMAWAFVPSWEEPVSERFSWLTDILTSRTQAEQRRGFRETPRRFFGAVTLADQRERATIDNAIHGVSQTWKIPVWHDIQLLTAALPAGSSTIACVTDYRDFVAPGSALLRGATAFEAEGIEISEVAPGLLTLAHPTSNDWPLGTRLYPVRLARMSEQPRVTRLTDQSWQIEWAFELTGIHDWSTASWPTYRSHPVFATRPIETEDLDIEFGRFEERQDNSVADPYRVDPSESAFMSQLHRWVMHGEEEHDEMRRALYTLRGRQISVWVPTHAEDFTLATVAAAGATAIQVVNVGYARFAGPVLGRRDLYIEMRSGTVYMRRITAASGVSADVESLLLDSALGPEITPAQVRRISFLRLMRADSDEAEIIHETDIAGVGTASLMMRVIRDDV